MTSFFHDLRYATRSLLKSPAFAIAAIVVLALGIGANTAIFSVVNAVLLRPLPYQDASRIMQIWHVPPPKSFPGMTMFAISPANYLDWKHQNSSFEAMAAYGGFGATLGGQDRAEAVQGARVDASFFSILKVQPVLGRDFSPEDDQAGHGHVVLLSSNFWRDHFGSNANIVGQNVLFNGESYTVIGVMPPKFKFPSWADVWVPLAWNPEESIVRGNHNYLAIGRLKPGATMAQAQADLSSISSHLEQLYPEDDKGWGAVILPLREQLVGDVRPALLVLLGAVAFVLLIACANVANLVLAKTLARNKEIAIRTALGASRGRVIQQLLAETLLLSIVGGLLGIFLARFGILLIVKFLGDRLPHATDVTLDASVLTFTIVLSLLAGTIAGLVPATRFTRTDVNEALKQGQSRGSSDFRGRKTRGLLIVSEVALSLVLLIGAGLMIRSLWMLRSVNPGLDPRNVLTMSLSVARNRFSSPEKQSNFYDRVLENVRSLPGVESAGLIDNLPLDNGGSHQPVAVEGQPVVPMSDQPEVDVRWITPGYLRSMKIPVVRGRDFTEADIAGRPNVVIISQSMAMHYWPNEDPLGKHVTLTFFPSAPREIVGVVGDVKFDSLNQTRPVDAVYWPLNQLSGQLQGQWSSFGMSLVLRTSTDPLLSVSAATEAVRQVDREIPVVDILTMESLISQSLSPQRSNMLLLAGFAGLALILAAVGIYSVLSYTVKQRVREIGIRMALGARGADVLRLVVTDGLKPTLLGVAIGLASAVALGRVVSGLIYGINATDVLTYASVTVLLVLVGLLASLIPALRATRVDPIKTLRDE